ncbi:MULTISPECIES: DNA repair protein RadC [Pseudomonas]|jgi:DNA repair protein RadC|uniref:DNA repair protein RadC n=1 Tax=Pseudomonas aphyarum TaxID=2942629 RepID=A0ABT5PT16_9PSED|nr:MULTISPECIES: DNA repair protein RadC [Pseudomonas]EJM28402.1 DNA repair protein radc [Pseudomonas sp. GM25]MCH4899739.1 DNA repair protein RadC [Pseudomonas sp. B707]MCU0070947.1 DNA repair protein RadC [Pseudomonas koreensis]MCU0090821.1 DNA repair protein RadC [Pseudomonas koreensis]MDD0966716.1 DNA repair protein RadC [Pseudomonas aphyarum]
MSIRDWPAAERPREKLLEQGSGSLSDAELLAIFLRTGVSGKSAVDVARHLLGQFGSLRALLEADLATFSEQLGLGPAKFAQLQAVLEMGRRHLAERMRQKTALENPQVVRDYLKAMLRHEPHEVFGCLFLDSKHQVLTFETLFRGSIDNTAVHPREVVKRSLANNAAAVILCHNHPSGNSDPSQADRLLTKRLQKALELIDVRVLDHFIVGDGEPLSMAECGWM